jgi:Prenyltransferase and squalene oxidase repeat
MQELRTILGLCLLAFALPACAHRPKSTSPTASAEARVVEFLQHEVPAWSRENGCYSCHNNGDAARALYAALRKGYHISEPALADTSAWVSSPAKWDGNQGDPGFSDKRLADVQFAASLAAAIESRAVNAPNAIKAAAIKVANAQAEDGSWPIDMANPVGSPATYGTTLATYMAWELLKRSAAPEVSVVRQKAENRLSATKPNTVSNAAVLLLFHGSHRGNEMGEAGNTQRHRAPSHVVGYEASLDFLRRAQTGDGGWGPYADSPPEAFDTALALLALAELRAETGVPRMIQRGRAFLTATQLPDGSWPATTRPSGGQSYAQQMSTTGWVTLALLATR